MKHIFIFCVLLLCPELAWANAAQQADLVTSNNQFALALYGKLHKTGDASENIFFSPYSISTALAMTYAGARGKTATQMAKTLHFSLPADQLHPAFQSLMAATTRTTKTNKINLAIANALWAQKNYHFLPGFIELNRKFYGTGIKEVDYIKDYEAARKTINQWVENNTNNKIQKLIPSSILNSATRLVLTNAIYFKGTWNTRFEKGATSNQPFHLLQGGNAIIPLMKTTAQFGYYENPDFQALELPYKGKQISMVVVLPRKMDGLKEIEKKLNASWLERQLHNLPQTKVEVYLPKFKTTATFQLKKELSEMGMPLAFSDGADFSGMTGKRELKISEVIHKAFVEVNEEGTEAAAATAVMMTRGAGTHQPPPVPIFRADHPFTFLIRDRVTGSILFMGRLLNPNA